MSDSYKRFQQNIDSIKTLDVIYTYLSSQVQAMDLSEILRAQFVLIVSAFDCFIHEIVRTGIIEVIEGNRNDSTCLDNLSFSFGSVRRILSIQN
jgi:hypothetical protein